VKWLIAFVLLGQQPIEINGELVYPRYQAEFTSQAECIEWLKNIWADDRIPMIFSEPRPCGLPDSWRPE
jgi:hypothetical protein